MTLKWNYENTHVVSFRYPNGRLANSIKPSSVCFEAQYRFLEKFLLREVLSFWFTTSMDALSEFVFAPPPSLFLNVVTVVIPVVVAMLGLSEARGRHLQYSKFWNANSTPKSLEQFKLPSWLGMLLAYTPALLAGVVSLWFFPNEDRRTLLLKSALTLHFLKRDLEVMSLFLIISLCSWLCSECRSDHGNRECGLQIELSVLALICDLLIGCSFSREELVIHALVWSNPEKLWSNALSSRFIWLTIHLLVKNRLFKLVWSVFWICSSQSSLVFENQMKIPAQSN